MTEPAKAAAAKPVDLLLPSGQIGTFHPDDVPQALASGATAISKDEVAARDRSAQLQKEYGGIGSGLASAGVGAASSLSFGLAPLAAAKLGGDGVRQYMQDVTEANPNAKFAGEVAGLVAPGLGELGIFGKGVKAASGLANTGVKAVSAAGDLAQAGARALVGTEARGLTGKALQSAIPMAARGAAEGAAYSVGSQISEDAIKDHPITAEKVLAAAGRGAFFGGALFGGGAAVGTVAKEAASGLASKLSGTTIADWLEQKSGELAYRSAGGTQRMAQRVEKYGGGTAELGNIIRKEAPEMVGETSFSSMNREKLYEASQVGQATAGAKLGKALDLVDEQAAAQGEQLKAADVVAHVGRLADDLEANHVGTSQVVARLRQTEKEIGKLTGYETVNEITDSFGNVRAEPQFNPDATVSFRQLRDIRSDIDKIWAPPGTIPPPELAGFKREYLDLRSKLENMLEDGIENVAGKDLRASYEDAKKHFVAWKSLEDASSKGMARDAQNRTAGLSEQLASGFGGVVGHAAGGLLGGGAGALIGGAAANFVRTTADFVGADLLAKASKLAAVTDASALIDQKISSGVEGFFSKAARVPLAAKSVESDVPYRHVAASVASLRGDPDAISRHVESGLGNLAPIAPMLTSHIAEKAGVAVSNIVANSPKSHYSPNMLQPQLTQMRFDDREINKFANYLTGLDNPTSVLADMAGGRLSRDKVRAVKDNYPLLFQQIQTEILDKVATRPDSLTYQQQNQLSILFGVPLQRTMSNEFVSALQETKTTPEQAQAAEQVPAPNQGSRRPVDARNIDMAGLEADRLAQ
jgi:hypothetical protein